MPAADGPFAPAGNVSLLSRAQSSHQQLRCMHSHMQEPCAFLQAAHLPMLEYLDISGCSRVVGTGLTHLASGKAVGCGALREVRAAQLHKLNDIDAVSLLDNMAAHCRWDESHVA